MQSEYRKPAPPEPKETTAGADGIPEVEDIDMAFPNKWRELLPKWEDLSNDEKHMRGPFCDALSSIFFNGGRLADYGITPKAGVDAKKVHRYIRATLGDFGPSHEHKIGGIAHMLKKWCDYRPVSKKPNTGIRNPHP